MSSLLDLALELQQGVSQETHSDSSSEDGNSTDPRSFVNDQHKSRHGHSFRSSQKINTLSLNEEQYSESLSSRVFSVFSSLRSPRSSKSLSENTTAVESIESVDTGSKPTISSSDTSIPSSELRHFKTAKNSNTKAADNANPLELLNSTNDPNPKSSTHTLSRARSITFKASKARLVTMGSSNGHAKSLSETVTSSTAETTVENTSNTAFISDQSEIVPSKKGKFQENLSVANTLAPALPITSCKNHNRFSAFWNEQDDNSLSGRNRQNKTSKVINRISGPSHTSSPCDAAYSPNSSLSHSTPTSNNNISLHARNFKNLKDVLTITPTVHSPTLGSPNFMSAPNNNIKNYNDPGLLHESPSWSVSSYPNSLISSNAFGRASSPDTSISCRDVAADVFEDPDIYFFGRENVINRYPNMVDAPDLIKGMAIMKQDKETQLKSLEEARKARKHSFEFNEVDDPYFRPSHLPTVPISDFNQHSSSPSLHSPTRRLYNQENISPSYSNKQYENSFNGNNTGVGIGYEEPNGIDFRDKGKGLPETRQYSQLDDTLNFYDRKTVHPLVMPLTATPNEDMNNHDSNILSIISEKPGREDTGHENAILKPYRIPNNGHVKEPTDGSYNFRKTNVTDTDQTVAGTGDLKGLKAGSTSSLGINSKDLSSSGSGSGSGSGSNVDTGTGGGGGGDDGADDDDDEFGLRKGKQTRWNNSDLLPVPLIKRTYTVMSYIWFWMIAGSSVVTWSIGGSLLDSGLSARLSIACIVTGSIIVGTLSFLIGWVGRTYHIGFTVTARSEYGMYGSFIPVVLRLFVLMMWFSIQCYWGGQSVRVMIGAIIPGFVNGHLSEQFSESSHLQKNDLISIFIFLGLYFILVIWVPPEKMQLPFAISFLAFCGSMFGLLAWSLSNSHNNIGPLFYSTRNTGSSTGWMVMQGITSVVGTWAGGALSQSDWTRFSKNQYAPLVAQFIGAPIIIVVTSSIGIIVTSSCGITLGLDVDAPHPWNPINLLADIQAFYDNSPRARAGVFFASLGIVASQIFMATILNSISAALDMTSLLPKYITLRRGAIIMAPIAVIVNPWQLNSSSGIFLTVLGGFGIFMVSAIGVSLGTFYVKNRRKISIPDLYCGDKGGMYWYTGGFSIVGIFSFIIGFVFFIPGWVFTIKNDQRQLNYSNTVANGATNVPMPALYHNGWTKLYNLSSILGFVISLTCVCALSSLEKIWLKRYHRNSESANKEDSVVSHGMLYIPQEDDDLERENKKQAISVIQ